MKRPRKKMSRTKLTLIRQVERKGPPARFASAQAEDGQTLHDAPPDAQTQDIKHTLPTQGALHRRHK